nr:glycosyltransferase family 39 protein [Lewinella sp. JB7]
MYGGDFDVTNPYSYRILPLLLIGLSYWLLGVTDLASALPAMGCSALILYTLYRLFRQEAWWKLLLAITLYFGMKWNLFYSDKLMPDIFVSTFAFVAWALYERSRSREIHRVRYGLLAGFALFLAFNAKGTVILLIPVFLIYVIDDVLRGRTAYWRGLVVSSSTLLIAYFIVCWLLTGSPVTRFTAISSSHYLNPCSYDSLPWSAMVDRLTRGYGQLLTDAGLWVHLFVAGATLVLLGRQSAGRQPPLFYPITVIVSLLAINFMTISLTSYNPVCLDPRHILLFSPILAVCTVRSLEFIFRRNRINTGSVSFRIGLGLLIVALLWTSVEQALYGRTLGYAAVKDAYRELIDGTAGETVYYGSEVTKNLGRYFSAFETDGGTPRFRNVEDLPGCLDDQTSDVPIRLLQSWYGNWHAGLSEADTRDTVIARGYNPGGGGETSIGPLTVVELPCAD